MCYRLTQYACCCVAKKSVKARETDIVKQVLNFVYIKI